MRPWTWVPPELPAMLRFLAFASVSGVVTNAAALHAVRTDLPHLGVRALSLSRLTAVRRSVMMCATPSGKTWNDIVKEGFSRTATPAEFCRRIQRAVLTDMEDAAYILHNVAYCSGFSREAEAELLRRGFIEDHKGSGTPLHDHVDPRALPFYLYGWNGRFGWKMGLRTDPAALALFDEKGSEWCANSHDPNGEPILGPGWGLDGRWVCLQEMGKQAVPARFADFVEAYVYGDDSKEHVWVNFDKAFRCGIEKILDNGGSTMDDDVRAWRAIISSYEKAWPDCGFSLSDPWEGDDDDDDDEDEEKEGV